MPELGTLRLQKNKPGLVCVQYKNTPVYVMLAKAKSDRCLGGRGTSE